MEEYNNMTIARLRALVREHELRGYSRLRKAELIAFLQENLQPPQRTRPPKFTRPPPPPPTIPLTRGRMVEDWTRVKKYEVTGDLNRDISIFIMNTIRPVIEM